LIISRASIVFRRRRQLPLGGVLLAGLLCAAAAPAAAATPPAHAAATHAKVQHAGGFSIRWPALHAVQPGTVVRVAIVPQRSARAQRRVVVATLVRVTSRGKPIAIVAKRRLRQGTFSARLSATPAAHYRLIARAGAARAHRDFRAAGRASPPRAPTSPAPIPSPGPPAPLPPTPCASAPAVRATLSATPAVAQRGQSIALALTNTASTCLQTDYGVTWQIHRDGAWTEIPLGRPVPAVLIFVQPGQTFAHDFLVPADAVPGDYRVLKGISGGGPQVEVAAAVTVTP